MKLRGGNDAFFGISFYPPPTGGRSVNRSPFFNSTSPVVHCPFRSSLIVSFNLVKPGCKYAAWVIACSTLEGAANTRSSSLVPATSRAWPRYTSVILTLLKGDSKLRL